ncbi:tripartite tricarboxylate transporter TctB family protein [Georgenia alba]|uniref:Tripartite tricarboxylate transporter TctB family protein n=1 Tax=Georgenia alba TaxID=2233858 RepID=A0ABW2Q515_9MICO
MATERPRRPRRAGRVDVAVGAAAVVLAAVFWTQRSYTSPNGGTWPDAIIVVLAVLGLALVGLAVAGRSTGSAQEPERLPLPALVRAVLLLAAWVLTLPLLGYAVGGVVFFLLTALIMRKGRPGWRGLLLDAVVALGVALAFYLLFTEVLYVRLPELMF